jgi:hypothetical protein
LQPHHQAQPERNRAFRFSARPSRGNAVNLSYLLTDSIGSLQNFYWIDDASDVQNGFWEDVTTKGEKLRSIKSVEYAFFAKDDFRIRGT